MITGWLMDLASNILGFFFELIPDGWDPPGWVTGAASAVVHVLDAASSMTVWIPVDFAFLCAYGIISTYIGGGAIKAIRIVISHFTGGGGSAA